MQRFIIRRVLQSILLLWAVMTLSWLLIQLSPGGPEVRFLDNKRLTKADIEAIRVSYGLDKPLYEQYFIWMSRVVRFDFGKSYDNPQPTVQVVADRIGPTALLGFASYAIGLLGIPLGVYAAKRRGRLGDNVVRILTVTGSCLPVWWLSLVVIIILANTVHWIPQNMGDLQAEGPLVWLVHLLIPAALLSSGTLIGFTRFVRSETLEVLNQDYVRTANAKGLPARQVSRWHVFRNSLIPVVTLLGYFLPTLISGAIITEQIFQWPGMGRLFFQAATTRDMPVLLTILYLTTVLSILGTLLADIGYGVVDPRVRYD